MRASLPTTGRIWSAGINRLFCALSTLQENLNPFLARVYSGEKGSNEG
jgi:hypothetical protein